MRMYLVIPVGIEILETLGTKGEETGLTLNPYGSSYKLANLIFAMCF